MKKKEVLTRILTGAREKVRSGWLQEAGETVDGKKRCAANAVDKSRTELLYESGLWVQHLETDEALVWLMKAAVEQTGQSWNTIPEWNDVPGRTQEEVIDTFDHAIKMVERDL